MPYYPVFKNNSLLKLRSPDAPPPNSPFSSCPFCMYVVPSTIGLTTVVSSSLPPKGAYKKEGEGLFVRVSCGKTRGIGSNENRVGLD